MYDMNDMTMNYVYAVGSNFMRENASLFKNSPKKCYTSKFKYKTNMLQNNIQICAYSHFQTRFNMF